MTTPSSQVPKPGTLWPAPDGEVELVLAGVVDGGHDVAGVSRPHHNRGRRSIIAL